MLTVEVREAAEQDIKAIHTITQEAFARYARDLGMPDRVHALQETQEHILNDIQNKHVLVGELGNEVVGSIRFEILDNNVAYVTRFGILPSMQNCGMGRALIEEVCIRSRLMGARAVTLHSSSRMYSLIRFYYARGFYIYATSRSRGYIRALLVKDLTSGTDENYDDLIEF